MSQHTITLAYGRVWQYLAELVHKLPTQRGCTRHTVLDMTEIVISKRSLHRYIYTGIYILAVTETHLAQEHGLRRDNAVNIKVNK